VLPSGQKLTLGTLATITLEKVSFPAATFQFYLHSGKERKVGWVETDTHVVF
jgi:hypothetical protein